MASNKENSRPSNITDFFKPSVPSKMPDAKKEEKKRSLPSAEENVVKKNKVNDEEKKLFTYAEMETNLHSTWFALLSNEFTKPYFKQLKKQLQKEEERKAIIFPPKENIFDAFNHCTLDKLKVVIIGQDPYHGPGQAHGLCFSVQHGVKPPPSLKNIYKEAINDVKIKAPSHGCLTSWSDQGVLLLNAVLTVRKSEANSHKKYGWETFTDSVIKLINEKTENVVFLLWGKPAQTKGAIIDRKKHYVITSSHPSPLGATKTNAPFIGSQCFSKANLYLKENGKEPIDWNVV